MAINQLPYIIAEIGLHAEGNFSQARALIQRAAEAGANAAKFQAVFPERIVSAHAPTYFHQEGEQAQTQREFFARTKPFTPEDYRYLAMSCAEFGVDFLCTPFDVETVGWLNPLVPAFKIASADITNIPLLNAVGATGKPVLLSTGAATEDEIDNAIEALFHGRPGRDHWVDVTLLHCVLSYPTPPTDANLGVISNLVGDPSAPRLTKAWQRAERGAGRYTAFAKPGYSDHTLFNLDVLTTAWLLGATVIEKHFTLDKTLPGNDHYHSMDPNDLRALVAKFKELQAMIGDGEKRVLPCEEAARLNARQSWHATRDLPAGHIIQVGDVVLKRPGTGLPAKTSLIGCQLSWFVRADDPITEVIYDTMDVA